MRAPVDDTLALIDEALVIEVYEYFLNSFGATVIEGEALSIPVTGGTEFFQLLNDSAAVFAFPFPCTFQETFTAEVLFGESFFLHCVYNLSLGCDRSMVSSWQPEGFIALHSSETDQNILQGFIQCVTHMQLTGDVRWWNYDGVWFFVRIWLSVEISAVQPKLIGAVLYLFWIIDLGQFFHKTGSFLKI